MKLLSKSMLGLAAVAFGSASSAFATPATLYIVGSTAFRAPATAAIIAYIQANPVSGSTGPCYGATTAKSPNAGGLFGAGNGIFLNASTYSAATVAVFTNWTGSAAGLVDVVTANSTGDKFFPTTETVSSIASPYTNSTNVGNVDTTTALVAHTPDMTFCDSFNDSIATTMSNAATATISGQNPAITNATQLASALNNLNNVQNAGGIEAGGAGNQDAVGVIPFAWYAGNTSGTQISTTNAGGAHLSMTQQAAKILAQVTTGLPISFLTGNTSDASSTAYMIGRNEDSGTRLCALAEAQLGFGPTCNQFELTYSANPTATKGKITIDNITSTNPYANLPTGGASYSTVTTSSTYAVVGGGAPFESDAALYTEPTVYWNSTGHSGYSAGGDVANVLLALNPVTGLSIGTSTTFSTSAGTLTTNGGTTVSTPVYFIGYLGFTDGYALTNPYAYDGNANSYAAQTSNGFQLYYNGVQPSVANIENGSYTFWAYEHMYYMDGGNNSNQITAANEPIADGIADLIFSTYADTNNYGVTAPVPAGAAPYNAPTAGILYGSMSVSRSREGVQVHK